MRKLPNLGQLLTVAGFALLTIGLGLLQYPDDHVRRGSASIDQLTGSQATQYTVDSLQPAVAQPASIALTTDEIAALEAVSLEEAQSVEHWIRLLEGPLKAVSGESLDPETTQPEVEAIQPEVPGWTGAVATALATALEEQAQLEAQSIEQGLQLIESMDSVPEQPLDNDIDPVILTEEHEAALAAHTQLEMEEIQRILEILTTLSEQARKFGGL
jgi:hypothetical protein